MTRQPQLTDTQCLILSIAGQREDGRIVLPGMIRGAAGPMVIGALVRRGLVVAADLEPQPLRLMEGRGGCPSALPDHGCRPCGEWP